MALPDLASSADLSDRGITIDDPTVESTMLAVASAIVREAAGGPVLENESTVVLTAWGETLLDLPGQPVTAVSAVTLDDDTLDADDYKLANGRLWRRGGWGCSHEPSNVEVTLTHGLPEVPADIVDLVCNLASAGAAAASSGESFDPRVAVERIDDYSVEWRAGSEAVASVMELPAGTRARLRARFGGGSGVVEYR